MVSYLNKFFEADEVEIATLGSGNLLIPGESIRDYIIPDGKLWKIDEFGGSSSVSQCEIELLYSKDAGETWSNPFDNTISKLMCFHIDANNPAHRSFKPGFEFVGNETDIIIRLYVKNYNTEKVAEIISYIEGTER